MKATHVASSYPLREGDSTAPFMAEMLQALAARGHEVNVLVPRISGLEEGNRGGVEVAGVAYAPTPLQVWGYGRSLGNEGRLRPSAAAITPVALLAMARSLRRVVRQHGADVVHIHWVLPLGVLAPIVPKETPVVLSAHGADARFATGRLRSLARVALTRADAIVAASTQILDLLATVDPTVASKAYVVQHGANAALFQPRPRDGARTRLGLDHQQSVALGVGRLVPKKGFDALISALPLLSAPDVHLYLVGDGPDRERLQSLVTGAMSDRVHFVGACDRERVADWYAASDVVVIPGRPTGGDVDSGPVVLVEALASGRPVVATRIGMAPDMIRSGENGVLLDSSDAKSLAEATDAALAHSSDWSGAARLTFEALGDWDRVAADLEHVYQDALRLRHGPNG